MEDNLQNVTLQTEEINTPSEKATRFKIPGKFKRIKWTKKKIILVVLILIGLFFGFFYIRSKTGPKMLDSAGATAVASYQDISVVLSGTGTIEAKDKYEIIAMATGDVLSADFEEGELVEEGQVLYKIDTKEYDNSLERAQNSVEKAKLSYDELKENLADLDVKSDFGGVVTNLYVKKGDSVQAGTRIADVLDDSKLVLHLPFIASDAKKLYAGMEASVTLENSFYTVSGTVRHVASGSTVGENNIATSEVEIVVENPGGIRVGDRATAILGDVACHQSGSFEAYDSGTILAKVGGDIETLLISKGDQISVGSVVAKLKSSQLNQQIRQSELSVKDANLSLESVQDSFENYHITAPISGTVVQKTIKAGDTLDNSNTRVTMAVIADLSSVSFTLNVDELDIAKVSVGQKVDIVADAYPEKTYLGIVDNISLAGTTQNGVTVYPVKVVINEPGELKMGMNVTAEVVVESKEHVLTVPIAAVNRGNTVYVKDDGNTHQKNESPKDHENKDANVPEGFYEVKVEVGINDENNIEIKSGLKEGDMVYVAYQSTSLFENMMKMQGGMMGGGERPQGEPGGMR